MDFIWFSTYLYSNIERAIMAIKRIDLAWVTVADIKKAEKFFVETLGMKLNNKAEEWGWLEVAGQEGGMALGIGKVQPHSPSYEKPGNNAVVTLTVTDIVASKADLEKRGVTFIGDIIEVPGHVKMATFTDPDNNVFQLVQTLY